MVIGAGNPGASNVSVSVPVEISVADAGGLARRRGLVPRDDLLDRQLPRRRRRRPRRRSDPRAGAGTRTIDVAGSKRHAARRPATSATVTGAGGGHDAHARRSRASAGSETSARRHAAARDAHRRHGTRPPGSSAAAAQIGDERRRAADVIRHGQSHRSRPARDAASVPPRPIAVERAGTLPDSWPRRSCRRRRHDDVHVRAQHRCASSAASTTAGGPRSTERTSHARPARRDAVSALQRRRRAHPRPAGPRSASEDRSGHASPRAPVASASVDSRDAQAGASAAPRDAHRGRSSDRRLRRRRRRAPAPPGRRGRRAAARPGPGSALSDEARRAGGRACAAAAPQRPTSRATVTSDDRRSSAHLRRAGHGV